MGQMHELLAAARAGDPTASAQLFELVYADLKQLAHSRLHRDGRVEGLDTTALVHESFLRLAERRELRPSDRHGYFAYVGRVMRSVVIDHVRERQALKRGGELDFITLTTGAESVAVDDHRLLAIHSALDSLERISPELHSLVEMRYFGGLSVSELAEVTGRSTRSIERMWEKARALLQKLIEEV